MRMKRKSRKSRLMMDFILLNKDVIKFFREDQYLEYRVLLFVVFKCFNKKTNNVFISFPADFIHPKKKLDEHIGMKWQPFPWRILTIFDFIQ